MESKDKFKNNDKTLLIYDRFCGKEGKPVYTYVYTKIIKGICLTFMSKYFIAGRRFWLLSLVKGLP